MICVQNELRIEVRQALTQLTAQSSAALDIGIVDASLRAAQRFGWRLDSDDTRASPEELRYALALSKAVVNIHPILVELEIATRRARDAASLAEVSMLRGRASRVSAALQRGLIAVSRGVKREAVQ